MPKIFLIKNRLHQQQQRLLESQNLLQNKNEDDRLVPPLSSPLPTSQSPTPTTTTTTTKSSTTPPPQPLPIQPPKSPEPQDYNAPYKSRYTKLSVAAASPIRARSRSISPIQRNHNSEVNQSEIKNNDDRPLSLVIDNNQSASLPATTSTSTVASTTSTGSTVFNRKRFHHRRYYFGQQHHQQRYHSLHDDSNHIPEISVPASPEEDHQNGKFTKLQNKII